MSSAVVLPPAEHSDSPPDEASPALSAPREASAARREIETGELQSIYDAYSRDRMSWKHVDWTILGWMILMHAGALAAPFFFTWQALAVAVGLHWLTASLGICLTYHRYLSHRSLKIRQPVEFFLILCGVLSGEGPPLVWASNHRLHHKRSDQEGDPHSPLVGPWWSHILWLFLKRSDEDRERMYRRFVPELAKRPLLQFFDRHYGIWLIGSGVVLYLVGGLPMLLWGLCMRIVVAYHSTWFVNSATHLWGYRNYKTRDESRNLWWVALLSYGEGWHNNHHAHPSTARAGHQWWEIDMTYWVIRLLRVTGLAYDVKDRIPLAEAKNVNASDEASEESMSAVRPVVQPKLAADHV